MAKLTDEDLSRLPERYRAPVVLCDLPGRTREMAARDLGCPVGTVSSRLARARVLLLKRLVRRGLVLPGACLGVMIASHAAPAF